MKISLKHVSDMEFELESEDYQLILDGNGKKGVSPFSILLHAIGACSGIDVIHILGKMRQKFTDLYVTIEGKKKTLDDHKEWEEIHLKFHLTGNVPPDKLEKAIALSVEKYCSVSKMLEPQAKISWSYEIK